MPNTTEARDLFGDFVGRESESCYDLLRWRVGGMPTHLCTEYYMGWAVGGRVRNKKIDFLKFLKIQNFNI